MFNLSEIPFGAFASIILGIGILAQWIAWRYKLPSILILLFCGFIGGQLLGLNIDSFLPGVEGESIILSIVGICVAIILFEGGLTLKFSELKSSGGPVFFLCSLGVVISFALTTLTGIYILGWDWRIAAIMGSILVVTGPTVIAPLIRHIKPTKKIASIVKWEGIVVDPIGAILAVLTFQAAIAGGVEQAKTPILYSLGLTILVGGVLAFLLAKLIEFLLKHHLIPDFLHSFFLLAVVAVAFSISNAIQSESGLLTVTVLGIALANQKSVSVRHIEEFKETLRTLIISILFIVLAGRIEMSSLIDALIPGLVLLVILVIIVRPVSVFTSTIFLKQVNMDERKFLAALAPRGIVAAAVTAIFAIELKHAAHTVPNFPQIIEQQANLMVPTIFIIIIGTVTIYGLTAAPLANKLGVAAKNPRGILFAGADRWIRKIALALHNDGHTVLLLDTNYSNVAAAKVDGIPAKRANVLSEYVEEELEFSGLGQLLAGTHNDEVNSLASNEFKHIFGSADSWQVAPLDDNAHHTTAVASRIRGRIAFPSRLNHRTLSQLANSGMEVKSTTISEHRSYDHFLEAHPEAVLLFTSTPEKGLRPAFDEMKPPTEGTTIYAFVTKN